MLLAVVMSSVAGFCPCPSNEVYGFVGWVPKSNLSMWALVI